MARKTTSAQSRYMQDDFVLTISDSDEDVPDLDNENTEDLEASGAEQLTNGHKRKRANGQGKPQPPAKKQKVVPQIAEEDDQEGDSDEYRGIDDGAFDPDFDFAIDTEANELTKGFEGWEIITDAPNGIVSTKKKALSVEEIIERRKIQKEISEPKIHNPSSNDFHDFGSDGITEQEGEERQLEQTDRDDELLAEDTFGMGAEAEDDEDGEEEDRASMDGADPDDDDDDNGDDKSDVSEEIAKPVAHPDDELSDPGSEDEKENAIMKERQDAFFAPAEPENPIKTYGEASFQSMSLSRPILKGLTAVGFASPTPIQAKTVPVALLGKDVVGGAVTGSGKTAAFVIPILERLLYRPKKVSASRVSILVPTRELAVQCFNVATKLASFTDITFALIVGGLSLREQEQTLRKRPDVIVATPGRFIDHMRNSASFAVESLEILVLDEADRMLEDGFADELNEILSTIPKSRQTMLFSATMTQDVDKLIRAGLNKPVRLMVDGKSRTVQGLVQEFIKLKTTSGEIDEQRRLAYLLYLCKEIYTTKTIIFLSQKALAHRTKVLFAVEGIKAAELHGSMSQEQRLAAITSFREGTATHLLATDLASRGLDIPRVETVINFSVPTTSETYLHRVGRTARAGRDGVACTIFSSSKAPGGKTSKTSSERTHLRPILKIAKTQKAIIRTRSLPLDAVNRLADKIESMQDELDAILQEEKEERLLQQTERDIVKGENLVKHEDEIASRPRRTWFQNEQDKKAAKEAGKDQRLGVSVGMSGKKDKKKLSNKEKKALNDKDMRLSASGGGWKKGREERAGQGVLKKPQKGKVSKLPGKKPATPGGRRQKARK